MHLDASRYRTNHTGSAGLRRWRRGRILQVHEWLRGGRRAPLQALTEGLQHPVLSWQPTSAKRGFGPSDPLPDLRRFSEAPPGLAHHQRPLQVQSPLVEPAALDWLREWKMTSSNSQASRPNDAPRDHAESLSTYPVEVRCPAAPLGIAKAYEEPRRIDHAKHRDVRCDCGRVVCC